jgi:hypothetical protein
MTAFMAYYKAGHALIALLLGGERRLVIVETDECPLHQGDPQHYG